MIITIDGPAGTGKSTAARKLAARLEIAYLDTGAMYRALAYAGLQRGVDLNDAEAVVRLLNAIRLVLDCGPTHTRVRVDGHDVSEAIRSMKVSAATSLVAKLQPVRRLLVEEQRGIGERLGSFVTEGRDQGSVVFPHADVKVVLDAFPERRAQRRLQEMEAEGEDVDYEQVLASLRARDEVDSRQWEPLFQPGKAVVLDTTDMSIAEVVETLVDLVRTKTGLPDGGK